MSVSKDQTIVLHEDEFTLTAFIKPAGLDHRQWPFPYLPKPVRLPSHVLTWQALLTQSSIEDRTRCYRLINELRQGLREMEEFMRVIEKRERASAHRRRRQRVHQQRLAMRRRRQEIEPSYKPKFMAKQVKTDSSDEDFVKPEARPSYPVFSDISED